MKLGLRHLVLVFACGCGGASSLDGATSTVVDAGTPDVAPIKELVCAEDFCGTIVDKVTGATANCGDCQGRSECGDNGIANVCGSSCMPLVAPDGDGGVYTITPACDYAFGPGWNAGYGIGLQFPYQCSYMDPNNCVPIDTQVPQGQPCASTVCGPWYCCVSDPDAGYNPLLPGAVAGGDGGLP